MRMTGLNFDSIPRLDVPLRFYLTAPFFALLAGLLFIWQGEDIWLTRWMPASLAVTHLMALGVMAMIMVGSLFQVMPVLCGAPIKIDGWRLMAMHMGLALGTLSLSASFLGWISFTFSMVLLGLSLGYFVLTLVYVLLRHAQGEQTRVPILLAVASLGFLLIAGLLLLSGYIWGVQFTPGKALTNFHASIGVFGWVLLLIMAVSFQVIPMFHVTPAFPEKWRKGLTYGLILSLGAMIVVTLMGWDLYYIGAVNALIAILYAAAGTTHLKQRKRKLPDVVITYWQTAFACLVAGAVMIILLPVIPASYVVRIEILLALVIALGFVIGVIQGMLLKIVPFLINLHLQTVAMQNPASMMLMPDHYSLISRKQGQNQYFLYLLVLASVFVSFLFPVVSASIGVMLIINWGYIGLNLARAFSRFYKIRTEMVEYRI